MNGLIYPINLYEARNGKFPVECGFIMKVNYRSNCGTSFQLFAVQESIADTAQLIIEKLSIVHFVKIVSVEDFND